MVRPPARELYVEGGGDRNPALASECRRAFSKLFERAGITQRPRVIVCGGRKNAYNQFCVAHANGRAQTWLLVDAEAPVTSPPHDPWDHVKTRQGDGWERPEGASEDQLHLMSICMETWLLADHNALKTIFGPKLDTSRLPPEGPALERLSKKAVYDALAAATRPTPAGCYGKGPHSFKILAELSPRKLRSLPWAERFLSAL